MRRYPGSWLVLTGTALWILAVVYLAAVLAAPSVFDWTSCELIEGESIHGRAERSWLPPGTTCTYSLPQYGRYTTEPTPLGSVVVVAALLAPGILIYLHRLLSRAASK